MTSSHHVEDFFQTFTTAAISKDLASIAPPGPVSCFLTIPTKRNTPAVKPGQSLSASRGSSSSASSSSAAAAVVAIVAGQSSVPDDEYVVDLEKATEKFLLVPDRSVHNNTISTNAHPTPPLPSAPASVHSSPSLADIDATIHHLSNIMNPTRRQWQLLNQLRIHAGAPERSESGAEKLVNYFLQLCYLESRFPMEKSDFKACWFDGLHPTLKVATTCFQYEKAAVLFNVGSIYSSLGCTQSSWTHEGLKFAAVLFQKAAGAFSIVRDALSPRLNVRLESWSDLNPETLGALSEVMLAQAHECFFQKANLDKASSNVTSQIAAQTAEHYEVAFRASRKSGGAMIGRQRFSKKWLAALKAKSLLYTAVAHYHTAPQGAVAAGLCEEPREYVDARDRSKVNNVIGERLSRLMVAKSLVDKAVKEASHCGGAVQTLASNTQGEITKALHTLESVNFENYQHIVLDPRFLSPLKRLTTSLVHPILPCQGLSTYGPNMPSVEGGPQRADIKEILFSHLPVNPSMKESLNIYYATYKTALETLRASLSECDRTLQPRTILSTLHEALSIPTPQLDPSIEAKLHAMQVSHNKQLSTLLGDLSTLAQTSDAFSISLMTEAFRDISTAVESWLSSALTYTPETRTVVQLNSDLRNIRKRATRIFERIKHESFDIDEWSPDRIRSLCELRAFEAIKLWPMDYTVESRLSALQAEFHQVLVDVKKLQLSMEDITEHTTLRIALFNRERDLQSHLAKINTLTSDFNALKPSWESMLKWAAEVKLFLDEKKGAQERFRSFQQSIHSLQSCQRDLSTAITDLLYVRNDAVIVLKHSGMPISASVVDLSDMPRSDFHELYRKVLDAGVLFQCCHRCHSTGQVLSTTHTSSPKTPKPDLSETGEKQINLRKAPMSGFVNLAKIFDRRKPERTQSASPKKRADRRAQTDAVLPPAPATSGACPSEVRSATLIPTQSPGDVPDSVRMCTELLRANKELRLQLEQRSQTGPKHVMHVTNSYPIPNVITNEKPVIAAQLTSSPPKAGSKNLSSPHTNLTNAPFGKGHVTDALQKRGRLNGLQDSGMGSSSVFEEPKDYPVRPSATELSETLSQIKMESDKYVKSVVHSTNHSQLS